MNTVVYYPHTCPPLHWLKLASLCWDKVYRITTWDALPDPEPIQMLDEALGGILDTVPVWRGREEIHVMQQLKKSRMGKELEFLVELRARFIDWIIARAKRLRLNEFTTAETDNLANYYAGLYSSKFPEGIERVLYENGLSRYEYDPVENSKKSYLRWELEETLERHKNPPADWRNKRYPKHSLPMPGSEHEQYERLSAEGYHLKSQGRVDEGNAILQKAMAIRERNYITAPDYKQKVYLPKDIALHYLALYASLAAKHLNSDISADGESFTDVVFHEYRHLRGEVSMSLLEAYLPKDFFELEPNCLAEIRTEFAIQRLKYQKEIESTVRGFTDIASEGEADKFTNRIIEIAKERVEETKRAYKRAKLDMVVKTFQMSLAPTALVASVTSALGIGIFAPAGIAATVSILLATKLLEWEKIKAEKDNSPWSYVINSTDLFGK